MDTSTLFRLIQSDSGSPHVDFWQSPVTVCDNYPDGLRIPLLQDISAQANRQKRLPRPSDPQFNLKIQQANSIDSWIAALERESARLQSVFSNRFEQAKIAESAGNVDESIAIYERCVSDWHTGTLAYERLRIIYTKRKQPSDAIRVCQSYLDMAQAKSKLKLKGGITPASKKKFADHIKQLEKAISS